jgi:FkbM family methyltransferase
MKSKRPSADAVPSAYGIWLTPNEGDYNFNAYRTGRYGFVLSDLLRAQGQPFRFLDIGANQGLYSLVAATNPLCKQIFAFEPIPGTAKVLRSNRDLNNARKVEVIEKAISSETGQARMQTKSGHSGIATLRAEDQRFDSDIDVELISAPDLDDIVGVDGPPIIVKIDVEGHEPAVLDALFRTQFGHQITTVFYENDTAWIDPDEARAKLEAQGFKHFRKFGGAKHFDVLATR